MKKCHSCGTTPKDGEKTLQEFGDEYYCINCLDEDGNPQVPNPVRKSVLRFWRERETKKQASRNHGS